MYNSNAIQSHRSNQLYRLNFIIKFIFTIDSCFRKNIDIKIRGRKTVSISVAPRQTQNEMKKIKKYMAMNGN